MSQSRVNEFFISRKGIRDSHPSKRRKLESVIDSDSSSSMASELSLSKRQSVDPKPDFCPEISSLEGGKVKDINKFASYVKKGTSDQPTPTPSIIVNKSNSRMSTRLRKKPTLSKGQQKLKFGANKEMTKDDSSPKNISDESELPNRNQFNKTKTDIDNKFSTKIEVEEVTSVWDDHGNQECTPRKKIMTELDSLSQGPKSRVKKTAARKLNQTEESSPLPTTPAREVKKKLELCLQSGTEPKTKVSVSSDKKELSDNAEKEATPAAIVDGVTPSKSHLLNIVSEMSDIEGAISPLAVTPEQPQPPESSQASSSSPTTITPRLQDLSQKLKALSKMDGKALKNRLKKKGLLGEVKDKLEDLSQATADHQKVQTQPSPVTAPETLPAYQRYDYLAKEGPPTLILPYTYRLLESAFQAMDTVVSMLHNRAEVCTFDKLRSAVQNINKKNFYENTVGQIKTVVPDVFTFKQERVPVYGQRNGPYVLTVEANLSDEQGLNKCLTKGGKVPFTASVLLRRKSLFKASLLKIVKKHHKVFLESLKPPLRIPDDKLSRWHPKFALDKVPGVESSTLPKSPNLQIHRTAKDILEMQVGKLNPRVEKALAKVAAESKDIKTQGMAGDSKTTNKDDSSLLSQSASPTQSSLKGIPPALLAKIRAKEALKMEQKLTRDPVEENRIRMMGHLPEMIRILRSYFVTEKKPAILMENVIKKLKDSYHTGMSQGELDEHLKLLKDVAPEFMTVVEIKRGKFIKLDKNVDITVLSEKINKKVKAQQ